MLDNSLEIEKLKQRLIDVSNGGLDEQLKNVDILIDGANMGHLTGKFDFSILSKLIFYASTIDLLSRAPSLWKCSGSNHRL